jgi:hypothetical protein
MGIKAPRQANRRVEPLLLVTGETGFAFIEQEREKRWLEIF